MTKQILQFGATGQLAKEMVGRALGATKITALSRQDVDLQDPKAVAAAILNAGPVDLVVNAAAYTAVDRAEQEPDLAFAINAAAPAVMAEACARRDLPFVHVSTDYVFDGSGDRAWREGDPTGPLGVYGQSKLAGETAILATEARAAILRTSWVFSPHGSNFVKTMLRLGRERTELKIVSDQRGRPTYAGDLAVAVYEVGRQLTLHNPDATGMFHFANAGPCSWFEFAEAIFTQANLPSSPNLTPIGSADYPTPAARPRNSVLDTDRIAALLKSQPGSWRTGLGVSLNTLLQRHIP